MKEKLIGQIGKELKLAAWLDLVALIVALLVTLTFFGLAAATAAGTVSSPLDLSSLGGSLFGALGEQNPTFNVTPTIIMFVSLAVIIIINWYGVKVLLRNKAQRSKINEGLLNLYKDEGIDQYYDGSIYKSYESRYSLFAVILGAVGAISIIVPLIIFIDKLTKL
jgi:amino acid transporter